MRFPELFRSTLSRPTFSILVLVGGLLVACPSLASEVDVTVVVAPGAESAGYRIGRTSVIVASLDPVHGNLIPVRGGVRFEPDDSFWEIGSDITHLSLIGPTAVHRIRWVAGETGTDGPFLSLGGPCSSPCIPWETLDQPENPVWLGPGVLGGGAARLEFDPTSPQTLRGGLGDAGSSDSTTTTSDFQVVIDDIRVDLGLLLGEVVTFYSVTDGTQPVAALETRWDGNAWQVRPVTYLATSTQFVDIDRDVNQIQLVRWTERDLGGIRLRVNEVLTHDLPVPPRPTAAAEIHKLLMSTHSNAATNLQLQFEEPIVRTSGTLAFQPVTTLDNFSAGLGAWASRGVLAALGTQSQTLPGSGLEYKVDLDTMNPLQSAFLEQGAPIGPRVDSDGWAFRFWVDPTALTLAQGSNLTVMAGCSGSGPCSQLRTRIDQTATGLEIVTTAADGQGGEGWVASPIDTEPHLVEVRFRTAAFSGSNDGMVELRIDGDLVGRVTDLENYDHPVGKVRLGAIGVPAGASGLIAFDAFESWRFD